MKKTSTYRPDDYQLKAQRRADYFKNCHNCHYDGQAKVNDRQRLDCYLCLGDPARPYWADKLQMMKVQHARAIKIIGLPKER